MKYEEYCGMMKALSHKDRVVIDDQKGLVDSLVDSQINIDRDGKEHRLIFRQRRIADQKYSAGTIYCVESVGGKPTRLYPNVVPQMRKPSWMAHFSNKRKNEDHLEDEVEVFWIFKEKAVRLDKPLLLDRRVHVGAIIIGALGVIAWNIYNDML